MKRTQRLMASVAAAVALLGSQGAQAGGTTTQDRGAQAPTGGQSSKESAPNPAADAVYALVDVRRSKALSLDDLHKRLPKMDAKTILAGLNELFYQSKIKKVGAGTADDPYRYYRFEGGGG